MNFVTKTITAFGLLVVAAAAPASAGTYEHIDQLALRIEQQGRLLVSETRHYRHTPEYAHLVADAREICRLATHVHEVAHNHGSVAHLASDLAQLDAKFHHLESVFDRIENHAAHGHGHIHGNTAHVKAILNSMENNIHHLRDDIASLRSHSVHYRSYRVPTQHYRAAPRVSPWGGYNPWGIHTSNNWSHGGHGGHGGHGWSNGYRAPGRSFSIGGGSSRFTFSF